MHSLFYRYLAIFTIATAAVIALLQFTFPALIFPHTWYLLLYFLFITLGSYWLVHRGIKSSEDFYNYSLGATGIRLFISAAVLFIYFFNVKENEFNFTFTFFILYFLFTGFEIKTLLHNLRENQKTIDQRDEKK